MAFDAEDSVNGQSLFCRTRGSYDFKIFGHVDGSCIAAGYCVLVDKSAQSPHILFRPLALWALVKAFLQVVDSDIAEINAPHRGEVFRGGGIAAERRLAGGVSRQPTLVKLAKRCIALLWRCGAESRQILKRLFFCLESRTGARLAVQAAVAVHAVPDCADGDPSLVWKLIHRALAVAPVFGAAGRCLLGPAHHAEFTLVWYIGAAFPTFHKQRPRTRSERFSCCVPRRYMI